VVEGKPKNTHIPDKLARYTKQPTNIETTTTRAAPTKQPKTAHDKFNIQQAIQKQMANKQPTKTHEGNSNNTRIVKDNPQTEQEANKPPRTSSAPIC
jgi:hypothetical protein